MIWVLVLVFAALLALGIFLVVRDEYSISSPVLAVISGIALAVCLICAFCLWCDVATVSTIDKKIEMYTKENESIEKSIERAIISYQKYENETFKEFAKSDVVVAVSLYPELKSDSLVLKQIEIYIKNNEKIKELKESRIDIGYSKWWLYFGGN